MRVHAAAGAELMRGRSRVLYGALTTILVLAATAVPVSAGPYAGIPSGAGWSFTWKWTSGTASTLDMSTATETVAGTGTDDGVDSTYHFTLTDTDIGDGRCGELIWQTIFTTTTRFVCDASTTFTPAMDADSEQSTISLCNVATDGTDPEHCEVQNLEYVTGWNAAGNEWTYTYAAPAPYSFHGHIDWDTSHLDFYDIDNYGPNGYGYRGAFPTVYQIGAANQCTYVTVDAALDNHDLGSSGGTCAVTQYVTMPAVTMPPGVDVINYCIYSVPPAYFSYYDCTYFDFPLPN